MQASQLLSGQSVGGSGGLAPSTGTMDGVNVISVKPNASAADTGDAAVAEAVQKKAQEDKDKAQKACDDATKKAAKEPSTENFKIKEGLCKLVGADIATATPKSLGGPSAKGTEETTAQPAATPSVPQTAASRLLDNKINTANFGGFSNDNGVQNTDTFIRADANAPDLANSGVKVVTSKVVPVTNDMIKNFNFDPVSTWANKVTVPTFAYNQVPVKSVSIGETSNLIAAADALPSTGNAALDKQLRDAYIQSGGLKQVTAADITSATGLKGAQAENVARMLNLYAQGKNPATDFGQYLKEQGISLTDMDAQQALVKSGLESGIGKNTSSVTKTGRIDRGTYNHFSPGEIERIRQKYDFPYTYDEIMSDPVKEAQFALVQTHDLNQTAIKRFTAAGLSTSDTYNGMNLTQYAYSLNTGGVGIEMDTASRWYNTGSQLFVGNVARNGASWTNIANNALGALNNGATATASNIASIVGGGTSSGGVSVGGLPTQLASALNNVNVGGVNLGSILSGSGTSNLSTNDALAYLITSGLFNSNSGSSGSTGSSSSSGGTATVSTGSWTVDSGSTLETAAATSGLNVSKYEDLKGYDIALIAQKCGSVPVSQESLEQIRSVCTY